jgi:hypothetical protein
MLLFREFVAPSDTLIFLDILSIHVYLDASLGFLLLSLEVLNEQVVSE